MNILILGANSGLGLALVNNYLDNPNSQVTAVSKSTDNLDRINNSRLEVVKADLTATVPDFDKSFNIVINCLGIASYKPFLDITEDEIDRVIETNLTATTKTTQKYLRNILEAKGAKVFVQIGSMAGFEPGHRKFSLYSATKMALVGLYNSLSAEFKDDDVRFLLIAPRAFESNLPSKSVGKEELLEKLRNSELESPENIAKTISIIVDDHLLNQQVVHKI